VSRLFGNITVIIEVCLTNVEGGSRGTDEARTCLCRSERLLGSSLGTLYSRHHELALLADDMEGWSWLAFLALAQVKCIPMWRWDHTLDHVHDIAELKPDGL
jgi:hypothetical protein